MYRYMPDVNHVSVTVAGPCSLREVVERIAASAEVPIPIGFLSSRLDAVILRRGLVCFGTAGDLFDEATQGLDRMEWWLSDSGLNIDVVQSSLGRFDEVAGRLVGEKWTGGLLKEALLKIADEIDRAGFKLKIELQPAQWKAIAEYNQRNTKTPVKTFLHAARHPLLSRQVRRRLYLARQRYESSLQ
jgi:hypothetical protein